MADKIEKRSFYEDHFYGMNLRLDSDKIPDGFSPLAVNVDLTRLKTVRKRKGTALLGQAFTAKERIQSIIQITNNDGTKSAYMVRNGTVYVYDKLTSEWDVLHSGALTGGYNVPSVVYKQRVYMTSEVDDLKYTDGTTLTTVGSGNDTIKAACMAVGQRTLFVGNVTVAGVYYPDRVYYSRFDLDNRTEGDEFWEETEGGVPGTLLNSTRFFRVEGGNVRAMASFPNRNRVYVFSDTKCYAYNVSVATTDPFNALEEAHPIGCAGPNAVKVVAGTMYWMDRSGKMYAWTGGTTRPEEISYSIDDENKESSIPEAIDKSEENLTQIAAFGIGKQVWFSVGNISVSDRQLGNACIKLFLSQNGLYSYNSIDTFPKRVLVGAELTINNTNIVAIGNEANILQMRSGLNDVNEDNQEVAIDAFYRSKSFNFGYALMQKKINNIYIQYKPQVGDHFLEILTRTDRDIDYIPIIAPTTPNRFGTVNMKQGKSTERQRMAKVSLPREMQGENFSFEFANRQKDQTFELYGFGSFDVTIASPYISHQPND